MVFSDCDGVQCIGVVQMGVPTSSVIVRLGSLVLLSVHARVRQQFRTLLGSDPKLIEAFVCHENMHQPMEKLADAEFPTKTAGPVPKCRGRYQGPDSSPQFLGGRSRCHGIRINIQFRGGETWARDQTRISKQWHQRYVQILQNTV